MIRAAVRPALPSGTVTFLFTDVEGSTRLLHALGAEGYADALAEHRGVIREACATEGGVEVDTQGDAFFFAFPTAPGALASAAAFTEALASGVIQVRVGLHTGTPLLAEEGYVGDDVHLAARVAASGHGGQVICSAATAKLVDAPLTHLGEHRLKDIASAVSIYQLGNGSFPPLRTISNTNLPHSASSFLGREAELAEVLSRIAAGARLLTLTGPGGTGKTRLALEAAASLVGSYKAGVFWVGLAALRDPTLVTETIAQTLGTTEELAEHIGERELLLLLDNVEQVVEAAPELSALVEACPNLTLVVTSRELLRVRGEVEYSVPPLAEPEAVSLFCERSSLAPAEEIAELCRRLDSLPLAVELAAVRTKVLSPAQILERLAGRLDLLKGGRDADPRQQTLRATMEWSYELLAPEEQQLFARLSVFAGGCALEAAEEVCDAGLDTLQSLVEKSLLRFTHERYWMLETIREFAGEQLRASGEERTICRRHAKYVLVQLQPLHAFEPHRTSEHEAVLPQLDDVRQAVSWAVSSKEGALEFRLAVGAAPLWLLRGGYREALRALDGTLSRAVDETPEMLAAALRWAADLAFRVGDPRAIPLADASVRLYEQVGDDIGVGAALLKLSHAVAQSGDNDRAVELLSRSVAALTPHGPSIWLAGAVDTLGYIELVRGNFATAAKHLTEALEIDKGYGSGGWRTAGGLQNLGLARLRLGQLDEAEALFEESVSMSLELHDDPTVANHLECVAALDTARRRPERAAVLLGAAQAARDALETPLEPFERRLHEETLSELSTELGGSRLVELMAEGATLTLEDAVEHARSSIH